VQAVNKVLGLVALFYLLNAEEAERFAVVVSDVLVDASIKIVGVNTDDIGVDRT